MSHKMSGISKKSTLLFFLSVGVLTLSGCLPSSKGDMERWIHEADSKISKKTLPKIDSTEIIVKKFDPVLIDPFQSVRIGIANDSIGRIDYTKSLGSPPLENVSLEDLKLIGLIVNNHHRLALVQHGPNVFRVGVGTRMGSNKGIVIGIDGSGIKIRQKVDDGTGKMIGKNTVMRVL